MGASIMSSQTHLIHSLLLRSVPSSISTLFSKPSAAAAVISAAGFRQFKLNSSIFHTRQSPHRSRSNTPSASFSFSRSFSSTISDPSEVEFDEEDEEIKDAEEVVIGDFESEEAVGDGSQTGVDSELSASAVDRSEVKNIPSLTVKEKKELASYAHSLGKKLKSQLVGKSGVTSGLATSFIETLEANELLKIKVLGNCPGELEDVVKQLEESTGSVVVSKIGRTVIIYRPSITKIKAEEEKRRARKIYARKEPDRVQSILQNKLQTPTSSNHSRHGSSSLI